MAETRQADVAIVGAGPAGASAAIRLVRAGQRVVLIDRKPFPREKICGGCLSGPALNHLEKLLGSARPLPGIEGTRITFTIGRYRLNCRPAGRTRIVDRAEFDTLLVREALRAGAEGLFGNAATILPNKCVRESRVKLPAGKTGVASPFTVRVAGREVRANTILVATGVGGLAAKLVEGAPTRPSGMFAQRWVQPSGPGLPAPGEVELHWLAGGYVGLASPRPGEVVVALAAKRGREARVRSLRRACRASHEKKHRDEAPQNAFGRLRGLNPDAAIWELLPADAPRRFQARGSAGFPWKPRSLGFGNVLLVGDAAGYEEPYTGEGIGLALLSGICAAGAILAGGNILADYSGLMTRYHEPIARRTRWISRGLQMPFLGWLAGIRPILPQTVLARLVERVHVKGAL